MSKELFSRDPYTGLTVWFDYDDATDTASLEAEQDVEPILEHNKRLQNDPEYSKQGIKNEFWHYASIPVGLQIKWLVEEGLDIYDANAWPQIKAKLNDPQYRYLKATTKKHGAPLLSVVKPESLIVP